MNRLKFYKTVTVNKTKELDFLYHNLSKFVMTYEVAYYRVCLDDLMRPDMISYKNYGTVDYWWLICFINNIFDPFHDFEVGQMLKIPNILDVYTFYRKYKL